MIQLSPHKIIIAVLRNLSHFFRFGAILRKIFNRHERGGARWVDREVDENVAHILDVFSLMHQFTENVAGKTGIEIGPGDNIGVSYCFLKSGCTKMFAIEKFDSIRLNENAFLALQGIDKHFEKMEPTGNLNAVAFLKKENNAFSINTAQLEVKRTFFEDVSLPDESVDFIFSNDVIQHVNDPNAVFRVAHRLLKPEGLFINNIDLAGLNAFSNPKRPLDYLTCPDWLWALMFSHVVTTNRVRLSEFVSSAETAGFKVKTRHPLRKADPRYYEEVKPHFLSRYKKLDDNELIVTQCVLVVQK